MCDKTDHENFTPMSLLNHIYKLFARIVTSRLEQKLDFYQSRQQGIFRSNYETNDYLPKRKPCRKQLNTPN